MNRPKRLALVLLPIFGLLSGVAVALPIIQARPAHEPPVLLTSRYPAPAPGTVRVIAHPIRNNANEVEWRWTVIGDRYWSGIGSDSLGSVTLSGGDASLKPDGGVNVFDLRILTRATMEPMGTPHLATESSVHQLPSTFRRTDHTWLSFPEGKGSQGGGSEPLKKSVAANSAGRALFTGDQIFKLPLRLPLYKRTFGLDGTAVSSKSATSYLVVSP